MLRSIVTFIGGAAFAAFLCACRVPPDSTLEIRSHPTLVADPCAGLGLKACAKQRDFVARMVRSTIRLDVVARDPKGGLKNLGGTGVVIGPREVLTAYHVVEGAVLVTGHLRELAVDFGDIELGRQIKFEIVKPTEESIDHDIALLRLSYKEDRLPPALRTDRDQRFEEGLVVWQFGHHSMWRTGRIIGWDDEDDDMPATVTCDLQSQYGDSGGPVVDPHGNLIGIVTEKIFTGRPTHTRFTPIDLALSSLGR